MKKTLALLLIVCLAVPFVAACSSGVTSTGTSAATEPAESATPAGSTEAESTWDGTWKGEVKIALSASLTGAVPLEGKLERNGTQLAVDMANEKGGVNGYKIILQVEDDANDAAGAVNVTSKNATDQSILCQIGPIRSASVQAVSDIIQKNKFPALVGGTSISIYDLDNEYIYRCRACDLIVGQAAAEYLASVVKATNVGILYNNDDYGNGARQVIVDYLTEKYPDITIAVEEGHNTNDKDMTAGLIKIKDAGCDAFIVWTHSPEAAVIQREYRELGMDDIFLLGGPVWGMQGFYELVDDSIVDGVSGVTDFALSDEAASKEFADAYYKAYGEIAQATAAYYYDAANIIIEALKLAPELTREGMREGLKLVNIVGVSGKLYLDQENGMDLIHRVVIGKVKAQNNVKELVDVEFVEFYN
jgi:branched-chain amino acid transport system substrate-binding protein